uniref:Uncharacterized protein n=1 Tax=Meloidogyne enterolobii TaxID=390850 RepID=A0A6V7VFJ1_MELEN|nr:unnamed protein product [Meloidogyne enterolobii]
MGKRLRCERFLKTKNKRKGKNKCLATPSKKIIFFCKAYGQLIDLLNK